MADFKMTSHKDELLAEMQEALDQALEAIGFVAEGYAKRLCPVDTGRLRNSISHAVEGDAVYIGTNVEYAPYVEMGTVHTAPQPYLKPAVIDHTDEYRKIAEDFLKG